MIFQKIRGLYKKKTCVILGDVNGKGASFAREYASHNYAIAFMDMDKYAGNSLKEELERKYGKKFFFFHGDAYSEEDMDIFVKVVQHRYKRVDSFFYNLWNWSYMDMMRPILKKGALVKCIYQKTNETDLG